MTCGKTAQISNILEDEAFRKHTYMSPRYSFKSQNERSINKMKNKVLHMQKLNYPKIIQFFLVLNSKIYAIS